MVANHCWRGTNRQRILLSVSLLNRFALGFGFCSNDKWPPRLWCTRVAGTVLDSGMALPTDPVLPPVPLLHPHLLLSALLFQVILSTLLGAAFSWFIIISCLFKFSLIKLGEYGITPLVNLYEATAQWTNYHPWNFALIDHKDNQFTKRREGEWRKWWKGTFDMP